MLADPVHAEDRLYPFAANGNAVVAFDPTSGGIRIIDGRRHAAIPTGPGRFAVPGIPAIFTAFLKGCMLNVSVQPLENFPREIQARELNREVPIGAKIEGVVPGGDGWVVVRTTPSLARVVATNGHAVMDVALSSTERVVAMWDDGRAVIQGATGWGVGNIAVQLGTVTSAGGEALIARIDPKDRRLFQLVDVSGTDRELIGPGEWRVEDAVLRGRSAVMSCLHPRLGFGLWDEVSLERIAGTISLFSLGGREPVIRTTGAAAGSNWRTGASTIAGDIPRRPDLNIEPRIIEGLPTGLTSGRSVQGLVIALHGGPDSLEWDDLRYGGLYRSLADAGLATLVINGPGSRGFGRSLQEEGWRDWASSARRIAEVGLRVARRLDIRPTALLGVSFGAWLALQAADALGVARVVVASPVLDLTAHIRKYSVDRDFEAWARHRFGTRFERATAGDRDGARCSAAVTVVLPVGDRVVDPARTAQIAAERGWSTVSVSEGHTPTTAEGAALRWTVIRQALTGSIEAAD
ncbi:alpha/beta hydrolase [Microbacterium sp. NPDC016588]